MSATVWAAYIIGIAIAATLGLAFTSVVRMGELLWEIKLARRDLHHLRLDVLSDKNTPKITRVDFKENAFKGGDN